MQYSWVSQYCHVLDLQHHHWQILNSCLLFHWYHRCWRHWSDEDKWNTRGRVGREADAAAGFPWLFHTKQNYFLEKSQQHTNVKDLRSHSGMRVNKLKFPVVCHSVVKDTILQSRIKMREKVFPFQFSKLSKITLFRYIWEFWGKLWCY